MSITAEEVVVDLLARTDRLERELASAGRSVDRRLSGMEARGAAFARRFGGLLAGFTVGAVVTELAKLSDTSKLLDAQLRLATNSFGSFGQAQADVQRLATQTRTSLEATTKLYARFSQAAGESGRTQGDAARATQTFSEALKISGAGVAEASAATLQFNQALASGVLRGEEFNSIMEASPRIARLLADALGVPIGQLRGLAEEGKITSDVLFKALTDRKFTTGIDAEFRQIPVTFGDAMQALENSAITTFGAFDKGGRFSDAIVGFLTTGTNTFQGLGSRAEQFGIDTRAVFDGLANVFDPILINGNSVFDALGVRIFTVREQIQSLLDSYDRVANFDANIENEFKKGLNRAIKRAGGDTFAELTPLSNAGGRFRAGAREGDARGRIAAAARRLEGLGFVVPRNADGTVNEAGIVRRPNAPRPPRIDPPGSGGAGNTKGTGSGRASGASGGKTAERYAKERDDLLADIRKALLSDPLSENFLRPESERIEASDRAARAVFGREGKDYEDPFKGVEEYDRQQKQRREVAEQAAIDAERQAQITREANVRSLADLYEDLFQGGTDAVWRNFKDQGLRTLALILAQSTIASFSKGGGGIGSLLGNILGGLKGEAGGIAGTFNGGFGGALANAGSSLIGTGLPRLANGGTIAAGGLGGVDRNVLSVNGIPRAMISANERLAVVPQGGDLNMTAANTRVAPVQRTTTIISAPQFNLKGAVITRELYADMERISRANAVEAGKAAYNQALKDAPAALANYQRLGG